MTNNAQAPPERLRQAAEVLSEPGSVVELRALKNGSTASGYFDDLNALAREASKLGGQGFAVYVTANPVKPALLARAENRIKRLLRETTSDRDILRRRWLLADFDPVRPAGVSATEEEKTAALRRAREVRDHLSGEGWSEPVVGDSGNGAHLLYPVDLPNDAESLELVRGVLEALSFQFSDERVKADTTTCNAARIWKLYGTTARKGDSTQDRPHRVSKLLKIPEADEAGRRGLVTVEQLRAVASSKPERPRPDRGRGTRPREYSEFDLAAWIEDHGVPVKREGPWQQGYRYILEECPWNGHTDNAAYVVQFPSGGIFAGCQHDSCRTGENRWRELREHYEPGCYDRDPYDDGRAPAETGETGVLLSEVVPERVRWLWEGRVPLGKIALIDGDPGTGKSAMTTDLAARVTAGKPWPDGTECEAGGVVILSAEDGLADTIRPRFDAAGGDASRVVALSAVRDEEGNERQLSIPDDLPALEAAIGRVGAVLALMDPLMAFLPGEVNSHRDQDVRRALAPLARLAERTGAAIVVVRHLNKASGGNALYRGGGSIGITGAARSGLLVAKHPEDDGRRVLASIKSNLAAPPPSLVFCLEPAENGAVRVSWKGESTLDASALLSAPTDHEERSAAQGAQDFLREALASGSESVADLRKQAGEAGISWRTVERAKATLGVRAEREGEAGKRGGGAWVWALPAIKAANPKGWRSKSGEVGEEGTQSAYLSQKAGEGLRPPSPEHVKAAKSVGGLNRPLSEDLRPDQTATLSELAEHRAETLSVEAVSEETRRSKSGPALALGTYLKKPTAERLEWLTRAILQSRGMNASDWKHHAEAVKEAAEDPSSHPLDCECAECL